MTVGKGAALLTVEGIGKAFSGVTVLRGVGFSVRAGEVLGFVGENGSGKSTTMNILAGVLQPDGGEMRLDGARYSPASRGESEACGVAFIQQELNIFPNLSVAENIFLGRAPRLAERLPLVARGRMAAEARRWLDAVGLGADPGAPAASLSAGERQLLEIARALSSDARVIIFDEPTTSLTSRETEILFGLIAQLKARGMAVLYISHALEDVLALCDRVLVLRDGQVTLDAAKAAVGTGRLVEAMVGRKVEAIFPSREPVAAAEPILAVEGVGAPGVVDAIDLAVAPGEIVGISGLMGSGRTELARILFGLDPHDRGSVRMGGVALPSGDLPARLAAGMAFLTEDRRHEGLLADASVLDNFALAALPAFARAGDGRIDRDALAHRTAELARALNLRSGPIESSAIRTLSGGNQQKVMLGRWLLRAPRLFILDEPTRGVDVGAKEEIYRLLAQLAADGAGILLISSEIEEVMGLADRIMVMHRGRIAQWFAREEFDRGRLLRAAFGQEMAA